MINQTFNVTEEQLVWLKGKAILRQTTDSSELRRVLREAMERDGVVLSLMKPAEEPAKYNNQS